MKLNKYQLLGIFSLLILSACTVTKPQSNISRIEAPAPVSSPPPYIVTRIEDPLNDPNSLLARRSVYFPDDSNAVQVADRDLLQTHARYLAEHPQQLVRIEGNCDERGSNEYNLALGQRRADAVKKLLMLGGASESQIQTVSLGEEKPQADGHDEAAWQQNRRADLKYSGADSSPGSSYAPGTNHPLSRIEAPSSPATR